MCLGQAPDCNSISTMLGTTDYGQEAGFGRKRFGFKVGNSSSTKGGISSSTEEMVYSNGCYRISLSSRVDGLHTALLRIEMNRQETFLDVGHDGW